MAPTESQPLDIIYRTRLKFLYYNREIEISHNLSNIVLNVGTIAANSRFYDHKQPYPSEQ